MQQGSTTMDSPADQVGLQGEVMVALQEKFGHVKTQAADTALLDGLGERLMALIAAKRPDEAPDFLTVPAAAYLDPAVFAAEKAAILDKMPVLACLSSDLANPGDYRRVADLDSPIFVTRTRKGEVKAFINGCRHRGTALVHADAGNSRGGFVCPYHGWAYSDEGDLKGIACPDAFKGLSKENHGLVPVACEERHGLVFVAPGAGIPIDIGSYLGAELDRELAVWRYGEVTAARAAPIELKGNWKLVYETFLETYHFAQAHSNNLAAFYFANANTVDSFGPHQRIAVASRGLVEHFNAGESGDKNVQDHVLVAYVLFPGIVLINSSQILEVFRIFPKSADTTVVQHSCYSKLPAEMNGDDGFFEMVWQSAHNIVMTEDFPYGVTTAQQTLASGAIKQLIIGRNELPIQNNHAAIAAALSGG